MSSIGRVRASMVQGLKEGWKNIPTGRQQGAKSKQSKNGESTKFIEVKRSK